MNKTRKMFLLTAINGMLMMEKYNLIFFFFNNFDASVTWTFLPHYKRYHEKHFSNCRGIICFCKGWFLWIDNNSYKVLNVQMIWFPSFITEDVISWVRSILAQNPWKLSHHKFYWFHSIPLHVLSLFNNEQSRI